MSTKEPILATANEDTRERITVKGGLYFIRGNSAPYFTITAEQPGLGICGHDDIERIFPGRFTDLIALHLCKSDGVPMHAAANALHFTGGTGRFELTQTGIFASGLETLLKRHDKAGCLADAKRMLGIEEDACRVWKPWQAPDAAQLARHLRIDLEHAQRICADNPDKAFFEALVEGLKPRWKAEAEACIAKHGLVVFGDKWRPK